MLKYSVIFVVLLLFSSYYNCHFISLFISMCGCVWYAKYSIVSNKAKIFEKSNQIEEKLVV